MKTLLFLARRISALLAWCLFFFWWREASTWASPGAMRLSILVISAVVGCAAVYAFIWILHNKRIASHGKRGSVSFYNSPKFDADALGIPLKLPPRDQQPSAMAIRLFADRKEYVADQEGRAAGA